jgi:general secretion pathway protein D
MKTLCKYSAAIAIAACALQSMADTPSPAWTNSQVQAHLRLDLKDDVKEVHFISTNNDGDVFTKVYQLKYADPYELRPFLVCAIGGLWSAATNTYYPNIARRINTFNTKVECIKYLDGVGMLVVSAEGYRFSDWTNGMSLDEIISIMDQPNVTSSNRQKILLYFPKFWDATSLITVLQRSGMNGTVETQWEIDGGKDRANADVPLNAIFFTFPGYSEKTVEKMLSLYDRPCPEALISYTVYEFENEIDSQVGTDFQSWKNGPGTDLFAVASRQTQGWNVSQMAPARTYVDSGSARYINFSPKWNTKYVDFLASKGKAQIVTSGFLSLMNSQTGYIGSTARVPTITTGDSRASSGITQVRYWTGSVSSNSIYYNYIPTGSTTAVQGAAPVTSAGVALNAPAIVTTGVCSVMITEAQWTTYNGSGAAVVDYTYYMHIEPAPGVTSYIQDANGNNLGKETKLYGPTVGTQFNFALTSGGSQAVWNTAGANDAYYGMAIQKAPKRQTSIQEVKTSTDSYGFELTFTPTVSEKMTIVNLEMINTSLVGFNSDGTIRTNRSQIKTQLHAPNGGERFFVGGIDKETVVRDQGGLPWFSSIPVLGWAFADEREGHKKSQMLAVIECVPSAPDTSVPAGMMSEISAMKSKISNYGVKSAPFDENDYGYEQFLLDSDKKSLDPLP